MPAPSPDPSLTRQSIEIYLRFAYEGPPPPPVTALVDALAGRGNDSYFSDPAFERGTDSGQRWTLRLGNLHYPFMKLRIDRTPDDGGFLYDIDTHDMHIAPAQGSPEFDEFKELMDANKSVAAAIEAAWESAGIPTFKSWLIADLARRRKGVAE